MASTTTGTLTSAPAEQKLLKKAAMSDSRNPTSPIQTVFGCQHIKGLLTQARQQASDGYTKLINSLQREGNVSDRIHKTPAGPSSTSQITYLCLQCPNVSTSRERHIKGHGFSVESANGFVWCHECRDFVYDPTFEEIRARNGKKRKLAGASQDGDKRLISTNTTATCAATGLRGLYNMGQTCFMSVILQSLIHNPFIRTFYLAEGHKSGDCERDACTSCALDDIFTEFFGQDKHEGFGAVHMLQGCWKGGGGLAGYSQQDAHEYLVFILNSLHEANTDDQDKPDNLNDAKECRCIVHQTFGGLMKSTVTCDECKNTTTALDLFMDLSLDIKNTNFVTKKKKLQLTNGVQTVKEPVPMDLAECLDRFTGSENLTGDSYHCRKCDAARSAKKKLTLSRLPPVIPVHLKRFSHSKANGQSNKVDSKVRFPLTLDLAPYVTSSLPKAASAAAQTTNGHKPGKPSDDDEEEDAVDSKTPTKPAAEKPWEQQPVYELSSVIVHKGKIDNGHYISYSRQRGEWFRFDDSMVVQVDEKEVLNAEAYMLFYTIAEF